MTDSVEGADNATNDDNCRTVRPVAKTAGQRRKVIVRRKKSKGKEPMDWRLVDDEFDRLHQKLQFTKEACCDQRGLNGHQDLPYYSAENSILDNDVSGECLFVNPPWKLAPKIVDHIRRCHAKDPENTKALIVLPKWPTFEDCTKGLTLFEEIPARREIFTRSPDHDGTIRDKVSPVPWAVQYWLLDESNPPINLDKDASQETHERTTDETHDTEDNEVTVEENNAFSEAADRWLPKAAAYVIMDPDQPEPLMRLPISFDGCDTDALVDNAATLNFVSGEFVDRHNLKWKTAPKVAVRVANAQRIASTRIVVPENLVINGVNYSGIQFRVLSNLKAADVILGLPAQRSINMTICPGSDSVKIDDVDVPCVKQDRHVDCFLLDCKGIEKLLRKQTRKQTADFFLVDIKKVVDEALVTSDFGPEFDEKLRKLLDEYTDVSSEFTGLPPSRGIYDHKIQFTNEPRRQRRNRLSVPEFEELKRQCIEYFSQGRVRISNSPYAAPIILVRKPDGSMRLCIDYRGANECTVKDAFPLPRIDELLEKLRNAKVLTHLDLQQGYHQIRMDEESIPRTAFQGVTPSGAPCLLEFMVMSFGLCNAPATFSRLMNHVLEPYLNKFVLVYLDDICIYSSSLDEHLEHLRLVLELLRKHKLHIKLSKCTWAQRETEYLGVIAGNGCLRPSPDKLAAVQNWPLPKTQRDVKSFVAFCSFYRKFVHHFSDCAAPLIDLYSGYTRRSQKPGSIVWNDDAMLAFETLKARLVSAPVLLIPECGPESTFVVATDASDVGLGAVLLQEDHAGDLRPCAYYARKLNDAERKYSAYDKEALAVVEAVHRAWRVYLEGSESFSVVTDHATLTHLLTQPSTNLTKRQAHFVEKLMPYAGYMKIVYRKGSANEADPVSRRPDFYSIWWDGEVPELESAQFFALDAVSVSIDEAVCQQLKDGYAATNYFSDNGRWRHDKLEKTVDGLFLYHGRIVIPRPAQQLRATLLSEYHDAAGHPGWKRLMATLMKKYWWKGIMNDCKEYVDKCIVCNRAKPDRRGSAPVNPLPVPAYPWEVVGVDYVTNLPKSGKSKYTAVMIVVCHLTKMAHFIPCTDEVTAEESADLFTHHVYRLHGVPRVLVSDRDPRFISAFWQALWRRLNTKLNMSTARRPQTDGLTERVNETMQSLLRCVCAEAGYDWASHLDMIEFSYNSFVGDAGKHSPFETYYGYQPPAPVDLMLPLDGIPASAADRLQNIRDTQMVVKELLQLSKEKQAAKGSASVVPVFEAGDYVKVSTKGLRIKSQSCKKLMDRYIGPYRVLERVGNRSYRLQLERGSRLHPVFHIDVLSRASSETPLRSRPVDAVDDDMEYQIDHISDVKLDIWPRRRGLQVQFLTHYVGYAEPEWSLLELLDDCIALDDFLKSDKWASFAQTKDYTEFVQKYPRRAVRILHDEANVIYSTPSNTAYRPR